MKNKSALISFTFDDFPRSALFAGATILEAHGSKGTYYTSIGLMAQHAPTGEIFHPEDLREVVARGHDLGCHTFAHCHSYDTPPAEFEKSIVENERALREFNLPATFNSLSYPIHAPSPGVKRCSGRHFNGCRAGGQTFNVESTDLNSLQSFFLEQSRDDIGAVRRIIDRNLRAGGWLIFSTHDVADNPTRYGCTPAFFSEVVSYAAKSGAAIVPVSSALQTIGATPASASS